MAFNSSWDGGNSSSSTNSTNFAVGNWWNVTLPPDWTYNSTLKNSTMNKSTADELAATNFTTDQTSSSLLPVATALPFNATANLTDPTTSLMNSNDRTSQMINPNVMGHARFDAAMWQQPGVLIGLGCSILGLVCVLIGIFIHLRKKRKSSQAVRRVRVMSGFDFNDGAEDDYQYNTWHKANLGFGSNEKSGLEMDGPITELHSYRQSNATLYSTSDDDEGEPNRNSQTNHRVETGVAQ